MTARTQTALEALARRERELTRWLYANFRAKLSFDEARDAMQDAFLQATAHGDTLDALAPRQVEQWLRRAARHKAIDRIRARDGEERYGSRRSTVDFDEIHAGLADRAARGGGVAVLDGGDATLEEVLRELERSEEVAVARRALERLSASERRVLQLRWQDELLPDACAEVLGISKTKYERLYTAAMKKLRTLFITTTTSSQCVEVRAWLDANHQLSGDVISACRDHLEACLHCRAYQQRRLGLIALLPIPTAGFIDRLIARLAQLTTNLSGGSSAPESVAAALAGGGTAAGGGAGVLGGLAGAKAVIAACGVAAVALCGGAALDGKAPKRAPDRPAAKAAHILAPVTSAPPTSTSHPASASRAKSPAATSNARATSRRQSRDRSTGRQAVASLTLEDFRVPATVASTTTVPGTRTATAASPTVQPGAPPAPRSASAFSGEFAP